jgi:hypothetical protein
MTQETGESGTPPFTSCSGPVIGDDTNPIADPRTPTPPDGGTTQSALPQLTALRHDESGIWGERYTPVAAVPAHAPVTVGSVGLLAGQVTAPITVKPQIRVRDVLSGGSIDRDEIRKSQSYVEAKEWEKPWQEAVDALRDKGVVIVVAPRGYGSTTFALRLLACHAPGNAELIRLEADWDSPKVDRLPLQDNRAYQVDLQDPTQDRFDGAFLNGLGRQSTNLRALGSCLVLAVADELWPGTREQVPSEVSVVHLDDPPDPLLLVEKHLTSRQLAHLVQYIKQSMAAREHIKGSNAVQALHAVDVTIRQWKEYQRQKESGTGSPGAAAVIPPPQHDASQLDEKLKHAIEEALGDWGDVLDALFGEPSRGAGNDRSLSPEDRCLLMSLALQRSGTAPQIEATASSLERSLQKSLNGVNSTNVDAWSALSRRGLRARLKSFDADIDARDRVTFNRPGYSEAVLAYAWRNYSGLRDDLITWIVQSAPRDGQSPDPATEALSALIRRLQAAEQLTKVRDCAIKQGRPHVVVRVMTEAALDEHTGRQARALLYDWASQRSESQRIVVSVCRKLIGLKTPAALVRLGRVAGEADDPEIRGATLAAFRAVAERGETARLDESVAAWQKSNPQAAKLGLLALLATESDGLPRLPSPTTAIDLTIGLRELLSETGFIPGTVQTLARWLKACAQDEGLYAAARDLLVEAARDRHAFRAGTQVTMDLLDVETPTGANIGRDLYVAFGMPTLGDWDLPARTDA